MKKLMSSVAFGLVIASTLPALKSQVRPRAVNLEDEDEEEDEEEEDGPESHLMDMRARTPRADVATGRPKPTFFWRA